MVLCWSLAHCFSRSQIFANRSETRTRKALFGNSKRMNLLILLKFLFFYSLKCSFIYLWYSGSWCFSSVQFISVQSLSRVWLFVTPWTAAHQASLSITNSWSLLKLIPLSRWWHSTISSSVVPFSSCLQSFPPSGSFQMSQFFTSGGQSIGLSASASFLPMNIQDWFPLGWTGWISLQSKGLSRVFSNTTVQKHQLSFLYSPTLIPIHNYWKNHSFD